MGLTNGVMTELCRIIRYLESGIIRTVTQKAPESIARSFKATRLWVPFLAAVSLDRLSH